MPRYAELHCHTEFSFLDGASSVDDLVGRAAQLGMGALAVTDHQGLYGAVRFVTAARTADLHAVVGVEIELLDAAAADPQGIVVPARRRGRVLLQAGTVWESWEAGASATERPETGHEAGADGSPGRIESGRPVRPRAERLRLPGRRDPVRKDLRAVGDGQRGPHLVLLARDQAGYRSLSRLVSAANLAGSKGVPRFTHALLERHAEGIVALSGCRHGEIARRLLAGDREGAAQVAERYARLFGGGPGVRNGRVGPCGLRARHVCGGIGGFVLELQHHLLPDDDWLLAETVRLARELGLPVAVTNDVHYAFPEDRELQDVMVAIRHGLTLDESAHLRRPNGEFHLKPASALLTLPPNDADADPGIRRAWAEGMRTAAELADACRVDLGFEQYRFPAFEVPKGETPFSHLEALCREGVRRRYHPLTPRVLSQLAHELDVIERTGLAEFFLICWDLMQFARERGIPAQGRGSAGDSIVAYVLGITRVDPIRHNLLFERFINEGRTSYPDVDIDFASSRREEVIRYVYDRYGPEHTGMVCNVITYRARSAVREVGYALGFPRTLVDRVAKALETYDSVMVRRDLEAEGGFAEFFVSALTAGDHGETERLAAGLDERGDRAADPGRQSSGSRPGGSEVPAQALAASTGFVDGMGQLNHARGGRWRRSTSDDEGGPGDTQVSVAWLQAEREHGPARALEAMGRGSAVPGPGRGAARHRPGTPLASGTIGGRRIDPGSGVLLPPERRIDRAGAGATVSTKAGSTAGTAPRSSVARLEPELASGSRPGTTVGLSPWDRWLELCTRIDGRPRHLGIHVGGMLVTAVPLVEIAPLERATMPGRVVIQFDKRDVETMKLIKLDLLGLRMLSAMGDALRDVAADCGVVLDLDRLPEDLPDVFRMIRAADTTGVFQIESRAQMQTLPKSVPATLDDLVVEVAIIRPGPIQGNAVHPYLRRRQGIEPVSYLHPSLEPVLRETLGVILYQEQVMEIAIRVAGFSAAESDGFRRAMGTWRSSREMEKLHRRFVDGCQEVSGLADEQAEELFRQVAAFASFGFNKSHAAAFARTAYESAFLKLYYPAQFTAGLINNQPMGFYPVEVLINDAKRHGVAILPVDLNRSRYRTTTEWVGVPSEPLPLGRGIERRPRVVPSSGCVIPDARTRRQLAAESAQGYGIRLGLHLVKGIGEEHAEALDGELERGPYRSLADVVARTGLAEEMIERLIRAGALDSLGRPRRELLWQLREVVASTGREGRDDRRIEPRVLDLRLPPTDAPDLTPPTEVERLADSYAILSLDARRQVIELFRPVLDQLGVTPNARLSDLSPGRVRIAGLVVTRQHPMTARGTVFLALEDETAMANVTLWPDQWNRFRSVVRRHALLLVDGALQREASVVNVVAHEVRAMSDVVRAAGGPESLNDARPQGYLGMRRG
ncbi:MAG: DNA polymerase III subunit alpha [Candidatus Limnocylindrales bacterium]